MWYFISDPRDVSCSCTPSSVSGCIFFFDFCLLIHTFIKLVLWIRLSAWPCVPGCFNWSCAWGNDWSSVLHQELISSRGKWIKRWINLFYIKFWNRWSYSKPSKNCSSLFFDFFFPWDFLLFFRLPEHLPSVFCVLRIKYFRKFCQWWKEFPWKSWIAVWEDDSFFASCSCDPRGGRQCRRNWRKEKSKEREPREH